MNKTSISSKRATMILDSCPPNKGQFLGVYYEGFGSRDRIGWGEKKSKAILATGRGGL
jgi:hypothetical protein